MQPSGQFFKNDFFTTNERTFYMHSMRIVRTAPTPGQNEPTNREKLSAAKRANDAAAEHVHAGVTCTELARSDIVSSKHPRRVAQAFPLN